MLPVFQNDAEHCRLHEALVQSHAELTEHDRIITGSKVHINALQAEINQMQLEQKTPSINVDRVGQLHRNIIAVSAQVSNHLSTNTNRIQLRKTHQARADELRLALKKREQMLLREEVERISAQLIDPTLHDDELSDLLNQFMSVCEQIDSESIPLPLPVVDTSTLPLIDTRYHQLRLMLLNHQIRTAEAKVITTRHGSVFRHLLDLYRHRIHLNFIVTYRQEVKSIPVLEKKLKTIRANLKETEEALVIAVKDDLPDDTHIGTLVLASTSQRQYVEDLDRLITVTRLKKKRWARFYLYAVSTLHHAILAAVMVVVGAGIYPQPPSTLYLIHGGVGCIVTGLIVCHLCTNAKACLIGVWILGIILIANAAVMLGITLGKRPTVHATIIGYVYLGLTIVGILFGLCGPCFHSCYDKRILSAMDEIGEEEWLVECGYDN